MMPSSTDPFDLASDGFNVGAPASNLTTPAMTGANGFAAGGMFLNAFSSIASSFMQANALKQQAAYQQQQLNFKAQVADIQAQAATDEGEHEAEQVERQGQQVVGAQRVSAAAGGVDVNSGSALETQQSTTTMSALDALTARNNAARQAWGYKTEAATDIGQGNMDAISAQAQSNATLLTGGLNAFSSAGKGYYYANGGKLSGFGS